MTQADKYLELAQVNGPRKRLGSNANRCSTYIWRSNNKFDGYQTISEFVDWGVEESVLSLSEPGNDFKHLNLALQQKLKKAAEKKFKKLALEEQQTIVSTYLTQLTLMIDDLPVCMQDVVHEVRLRD